MDLDDFGCISTFVRLSIFFLRSRLIRGIFDEWCVGGLVEKFTDVDGGWSKGLQMLTIGWSKGLHTLKSGTRKKHALL